MIFTNITKIKALISAKAGKLIGYQFWVKDICNSHLGTSEEQVMRSPLHVMKVFLITWMIAETPSHSGSQRRKQLIKRTHQIGLDGVRLVTARNVKS